ncbi:MAG: SpoIIE family protein phosphatase [Candidatus Methanomethylophilaceae archaeon]
MLIPYLNPDGLTFEILWILFYLIQMVFTGFLMGRVLERRYSVPIVIGGWVVIVGVPLIPAVLTMSGVFGDLDYNLFDGSALVSVNMLFMPLTVAVSAFALYKGEVRSRLTVSLIDYVVVMVGSSMVSLGVVELIDSYFVGNTYVDLMMCAVAFGAITVLLMGNRMNEELGRFVRESRGYAGSYMTATVFMAVCITGCLMLWLFEQGSGSGLTSIICIMTAVTFVVMIRVMFIGISGVISYARKDAELETARSLQQSIIPDGRSLDWMRGVSIRSVMEPAREIAGDFCDFFPITDRRVGIVVADVSGKGIPAALYMMRCKSTIKDRMMSGSPLEDAVTSANSSLSEDNPTCMFVTAFIASLDLDTGELEYVNAGHVPPFTRLSGDITRLDGGRGPMMGFMDHRYTSSRITLSDGDAILAYTDGVNEADHGGRFYGEDRIPGIISDNTDAGVMVDSLRSDVRSFMEGSEATDDITIVAAVFRKTDSKVFEARRGLCPEAVSWVSERFDPMLSMKAELVTEEIFLNIAENAYPDGDGDVRITMERSGGNISISFIDSGVMFDPTAVPNRNDGVPLDEREPGGEGIRLVSAMADSMSYERRGDRNMLTVTFTTEKEEDRDV